MTCQVFINTTLYNELLLLNGYKCNMVPFTGNGDVSCKSLEWDEKLQTNKATNKQRNKPVKSRIKNVIYMYSMFPSLI